MGVTPKNKGVITLRSLYVKINRRSWFAFDVIALLFLNTTFSNRINGLSRPIRRMLKVLWKSRKCPYFAKLFLVSSLLLSALAYNIIIRDVSNEMTGARQERYVAASFTLCRGWGNKICGAKEINRLFYARLQCLFDLIWLTYELRVSSSFRIVKWDRTAA